MANRDAFGLSDAQQSAIIAAKVAAVSAAKSVNRAAAAALLIKPGDTIGGNVPDITCMQGSTNECRRTSLIY